MRATNHLGAGRLDACPVYPYRQSPKHSRRALNLHRASKVRAYDRAARSRPLLSSAIFLEFSSSEADQSGDVTSTIHWPGVPGPGQSTEGETSFSQLRGRRLFRNFTKNDPDLDPTPPRGPWTECVMV